MRANVGAMSAVDARVESRPAGIPGPINTNGTSRSYQYGEPWSVPVARSTNQSV